MEPHFLLNGKKYEGQLFWATIFSFLVCFPISIPRKIGTLRYASLLSFTCGIYLVAALIVTFALRDHKGETGKLLSSSYEYIDWSLLNWYKIDIEGLTSTLPIVVFSYMYQPGIPLIFRELQGKSYSRMDKVVLRGSSGAILIYITGGLFGYLIVLGDAKNTAKLASDKDLLSLDYKKNIFMSVVSTHQLLRLLGSSWTTIYYYVRVPTLCSSC